MPAPMKNLITFCLHQGRAGIVPSTSVVLRLTRSSVSERGLTALLPSGASLDPGTELLGVLWGSRGFHRGQKVH